MYAGTFDLEEPCVAPWATPRLKTLTLEVGEESVPGPVSGTLRGREGTVGAGV